MAKIGINQERVFVKNAAVVTDAQGIGCCCAAPPQACCLPTPVAFNICRAFPSGASFYINGAHADIFIAGVTFEVTGSLANDGTYVVISSEVDGPFGGSCLSPYTRIIVGEAFGGSDNSGQVTLDECQVLPPQACLDLGGVIQAQPTCTPDPCGPPVGGECPGTTPGECSGFGEPPCPVTLLCQITGNLTEFDGSGTCFCTPPTDFVATLLGPSFPCNWIAFESDMAISGGDGRCPDPVTAAPDLSISLRCLQALLPQPWRITLEKNFEIPVGPICGGKFTTRVTSRTRWRKIANGTNCFTGPLGTYTFEDWSGGFGDTLITPGTCVVS